MESKEYPRYPHCQRVWFEPAMMENEAYRTLTSAEKDILNIFFCMRKFKKKKNRRTRKIEYEIVNDGQIVFTYTMAEKWGISLCTFTRAIDHLLYRGFIEIAHASDGYKDCTLFGYSERWRKYGTPEHVPAYRKKPENGVGFQGRFKTHPQS